MHYDDGEKVKVGDKVRYGLEEGIVIEVYQDCIAKVDFDFCVMVFNELEWKGVEKI